MKEVLPTPSSAIVRNETKRIHELFDQFVIPSYARFDLVLERGDGSYVWDVDGKRYLDLAGGIAVCSLGHAHPEITKALAEQSQEADSRLESLLYRTAGAAGQTDCRLYCARASLLLQ